MHIFIYGVFYLCLMLRSDCIDTAECFINCIAA